jgi:hypothetical protein
MVFVTTVSAQEEPEQLITAETNRARVYQGDTLFINIFGRPNQTDIFLTLFFEQVPMKAFTVQLDPSGRYSFGFFITEDWDIGEYQVLIESGKQKLRFWFFVDVDPRVEWQLFQESLALQRTNNEWFINQLWLWSVITTSLLAIFVLLIMWVIYRPIPLPKALHRVITRTWAVLQASMGSLYSRTLDAYPLEFRRYSYKSARKKAAIKLKQLELYKQRKEQLEKEVKQLKMEMVEHKKAILRINPGDKHVKILEGAVDGDTT